MIVFNSVRCLSKWRKNYKSKKPTHDENEIHVSLRFASCPLFTLLRRSSVAAIASSRLFVASAYSAEAAASAGLVEAGANQGGSTRRGGAMPNLVEGANLVG